VPHVRSDHVRLPPAWHRADRSHVRCPAGSRPARRGAHRGAGRTTSGTRRTLNVPGGWPGTCGDANVTLPGGARLTVEAFQALGQVLGASTGSDALHYLLEDPFAGSEPSDSFLHRAQSRLSFAEAPLYAALHEACYAQEQATRWSAQRIRGEFPGFDPAAALAGDAPLLFTGEMIYPWMFDTRPRAPAAAGRGAGNSPSGSPGRACTTPTGWEPTRSRPRPPSTSTTCTSPASSRWRPGQAAGGHLSAPAEQAANLVADGPQPPDR
jgi:hypothetical protein